MLRIEVAGTPIGGEDAREAAWVSRVSDAAAWTEVVLTFTLAVGRKVDLDNLVRPALRGLKKAGLYGRGYGGLKCVTAVKRFASEEGLVVTAGRPATPSAILLTAEAEQLPVGDRWTEWKGAWASTVAGRCVDPPAACPAWVGVEINTERSLVDLMKPVIDGLEPLLGRDPRGRLRFCPNDHLIEWLQFRRVPAGPAVRLSAGVLPGEPAGLFSAPAS